MMPDAVDSDETATSHRIAPRTFRLSSATFAKIGHLRAMAGCDTDELFALAADLLEAQILGASKAAETQHPLADSLKGFEAWNARVVASVRGEVNQLITKALAVAEMQSQCLAKESELGRLEQRLKEEAGEELDKAKQMLESQMQLTVQSLRDEIAIFRISNQSQADAIELLQRDNHLLLAQANELTNDRKELRSQLARQEAEIAEARIIKKDYAAMLTTHTRLQHDMEVTSIKSEAMQSEMLSLRSQLAEAWGLIKILSAAPRDQRDLIGMSRLPGQTAAEHQEAGVRNPIA